MVLVKVEPSPTMSRLLAAPMVVLPARVRLPLNWLVVPVAPDAISAPLAPLAPVPASENAPDLVIVVPPDNASVAPELTVPVPAAAPRALLPAAVSVPCADGGRTRVGADAGEGEVAGAGLGEIAGAGDNAGVTVAAGVVDRQRVTRSEVDRAAGTVERGDCLRGIVEVKRAAVDSQGAGARRQGCPAVHGERARTEGRAAGIGVGATERERAGTGLGDAEGRPGDDRADAQVRGRRAGVTDGEGAAGAEVEVAGNRGAIRVVGGVVGDVAAQRERAGRAGDGRGGAAGAAAEIERANRVGAGVVIERAAENVDRGPGQDAVRAERECAGGDPAGGSPMLVVPV